MRKVKDLKIQRSVNNAILLDNCVSLKEWELHAQISDTKLYTLNYPWLVIPDETIYGSFIFQESLFLSARKKRNVFVQIGDNDKTNRFGNPLWTL